VQEPPDYDDVDTESSNVLVFRNGAGDPVAVPTDVVTAAERAYRCYQARIGGMSWNEIARVEGYPTPAAARYDVDRYLSEGSALVVEKSQREMLTLEVYRMDALQHAVWPGAMAGHVPSATLAMNIVMNRAKLVGMDPDKMENRGDQVRTVVVVPPDSAGYLAALQRAAEQGTQNGNTVEEQQTDQQGAQDGNEQEQARGRSGDPEGPVPGGTGQD
jgi:hypothetical protein